MAIPESLSLDEIVRQAATLDPDDQAAFLRRACGDDNDRYQQALDSLRSNPEWWNHSIDNRHFSIEDDSVSWINQVIGSYRVLSALGQGGMGDVLLAERADDQFRHRVAIKLVKRGVQSKQVQGRLKIERQILASLDHPNIARLLDGGTTSQGTPYIVMEYIEGEPIDVYCNHHCLTIKQRLELFRTVCSAVHSAHQNLIVHRDLKPSNILVTADGMPKLLDFGIAKMLDDRQMLHTMAVTQADIRVMTPEHASPEQVRGDTITTASDIYSLGVLLYELLCGRRPYEIKSHRFSEMEKAICDEPPIPLRSILNSHDDPAIEQLRVICNDRSTTATKLRHELRGDLSDIVSTAIRKEPERRYSSAEQLSADIGRYLSAMPITARRDTWGYRSAKLIQRHKFGVATAVLAVLALVVFSLSTVLQSRRIAQEQTRAERVSGFLVGLFEQADPSHSRGNDITAREIVDAGARRIDRELRDEPDTRAALMATMGQVYSGLGLYDDSIHLLRESLDVTKARYGADGRETAFVMQRLGNSLVQQGDLAAAEPLLEGAVRILRDKSPRSSLEVASAIAGLGELRRKQERFEDSEKLFRESLEILSNLGPPAIPEMLETLNSYAILLANRGDFQGAEQSYRRALQLGADVLGPDHPKIIMTTHNLAVSLVNQGRYDEAQALFERILTLSRKVLGPEHPDVITALSNYGDLLRRKHDYNKSISIFKEALDLDRKVRGPTHSRVGYDLVDLGLALHDVGDFAQAEARFREALKIFATSLPPNHQYIGWALSSLGTTLISLKRETEAEITLKQALEIFVVSLPTSNPLSYRTRGALGEALAMQKRYSEAEPLLTQSYRALIESRGTNDPDVARLKTWIAKLYKDWRRPEEAGRFFSSIASIAK